MKYLIAILLGIVPTAWALERTFEAQLEGQRSGYARFIVEGSGNENNTENFKLTLFHRVGFSPVESNLETWESPLGGRAKYILKGQGGTLFIQEWQWQNNATEKGQIPLGLPQNIPLAIWLQNIKNQAQLPRVCLPLEATMNLEKSPLPKTKPLCLQFIETNKKASQEAPNIRFDLDHMNSVEDSAHWMSIIQNKTKTCVQELDIMENDIRKSLADIPYNIHRKLINAKDFCNKFNTIFKNKSPLNREFLDGIRLALKQDGNKEEWPQVLHDWEENLTFLNSDSLPFTLKTWDRLLERLIFEVKNSVTLQKAVKTKAIVKFTVPSLARNAVMKATLKHKNPLLQIKLEATAQSQHFTNTQDHEENFNAGNPENPGEIYDILGQNRYVHSNTLSQSLAMPCRHQKGAITLRLPKDVSGFYRHPLLEGVLGSQDYQAWAKAFLTLGVATGECSQLKIITPFAHTLEALKLEIEEFQTHMLKWDYEFQLSNGMPKALWLIPGTYELKVLSLIDSTILLQKTIVIKESNQVLFL